MKVRTESSEYRYSRVSHGSMDWGLLAKAEVRTCASPALRPREQSARETVAATHGHVERDPPFAAGMRNLRPLGACVESMPSVGKDSKHRSICHGRYRQVCDVAKPCQAIGGFS